CTGASQVRGSCGPSTPKLPRPGSRSDPKKVAGMLWSAWTAWTSPLGPQASSRRTSRSSSGCF
ncbi:unnamed protein product, partial [Effrenium voratum]